MKPTVFYVEKEPCPELHEHILKHLPRMQYWYEWQGCELVYLPLHQLASVEWNSVREYLSYQFPVLNRPEFSEVLGTLKEPAHLLVNRLLVQANLQHEKGRAFLLYTDRSLQQLSRQFEILGRYQPDINTVEEFFFSGFRQLEKRMEEPKVSLFCITRESKIDVSSDFSDDIYQETEHAIHDEEIPISAEIKAQVDKLMQIGDRTAVLDVVVHLLNNLNPYLKADNASVLKMLQRHWSQYAVAGRPSRLLIDAHTRIYLTDFGNKEVRMTPLPKTVFLFYLRHPEGIAFPYLSDHRNELEQIYSRITNRSNTEEIRQSIADLVNPLNNSINEKCARIKEAFVKIMDISIAANYIVHGPRGGMKTISLDRNLVTFDVPQLQGCRD